MTDSLNGLKQLIVERVIHGGDLSMPPDLDFTWTAPHQPLIH